MNTAPQTSIETEIEAIFDRYHADRRNLGAVVNYVRAKIDATERDQLAAPLLIMLDRLRTAANTGWDCDCILIAAQLDQVPGCRLGHLAHSRFSTVAAIAQRVNWWIETLNLPRPNHLRTELARREYVEAVKRARWRPRRRKLNAEN